MMDKRGNRRRAKEECPRNMFSRTRPVEIWVVSVYQWAREKKAISIKEYQRRVSLDFDRRNNNRHHIDSISYLVFFNEKLFLISIKLYQFLNWRIKTKVFFIFRTCYLLSYASDLVLFVCTRRFFHVCDVSNQYCLSIDRID